MSGKGNSKSNSQKKKRTSKKKDLDLTTRIRIDKERLDDSDSLDTSFLEGRIKKEKAKERVLRDKKTRTIPLKLIKLMLLGLFIIVLIFIAIKVIPDIHINSPKTDKSVEKKVEKKKSKKKKQESKKTIDDNYVFIGDFYTENLDLEKFAYPYVKVTDKKLKTKDILDKMNEKIYQYNPSVVLLEVGINDLSEDVSLEDIVKNMEEIIDGISENRPYAEVYIESIYPINRDIDEFDNDILSESFDDDDIFEVNSKLNKLAKEKKVKYIDIYEEIAEKKRLKKEYTDDGVHLNEDGYKKVMSLIKKKIGVSS